MRARGLHLLPVVAAAWIAAGVATHIPASAPGLAIGAWMLVVAVIVTAFRARSSGMRRALVIMVLAVCAAAASASHVALAQPARDALLERAVDGGRAIDVEAVVTGKIEPRVDGTLAFDARAISVRVGAERHPTGVEIAVRVDPTDVDDAHGDLDVGARVVAQGTARAGYAGDRAAIEVSAARGLRVVSGPDGGAEVTASLRRGLVSAAGGLPGPGAGLVPGLAVGDTSAVESDLDAAMKRASLSHLTAASGANCALVVGLAIMAAAALGAGRSLRVGVGAAALVGFVMLVTPEPSVVRAATMAGIAMLALVLGRAGAGLAVLSIAVAVLLVADPWLSGSLGFALSAAATASLLLFARPLAKGLARWMPHPLALALSVPLAAQLACGPLLVLIEPSVPVYGVLANLLAAPAAPLATVLGLAACLTGPLPWLQDGLTALAWVPASWIAATAETVAQLPGDLLPWAEGWAGAALLAAAGVAIGVAIGVRPGPGRRRRMLRGAAVGALAIGLGVAAGTTATSTVAGRWTFPPDWSILACDVGQGDAVLVRSAGAVALIDTGPDPVALENCLARVGVARIDLLVLTHFDIDHVGGVDAVRGRVGTVLHGPITEPRDALTLTQLADAGAQVVAGARGIAGALGEARWRVLWPRVDERAFAAGNDTSLVLDIRGGGVPSGLFLGDLSEEPQRALAASGGLSPPYAVVKVAHHGSADQDDALYATVRARVALLTVGENTYGHPRAEIMDVVARAGAVIARTDTEGALALTLTASGIEVWRERAGERVGAPR